MERVNKPWGYEDWLHQGSYVVKEILITAGHRTSLQLHEQKEETNYIVSGVMELTVGDEIKRLKSHDFFHITPNTIHRVTAISDLLMLEASTPEVDDVIRIQDDTNRPDGRIESEHK